MNDEQVLVSILAAMFIGPHRASEMIDDDYAVELAREVVAKVKGIDEVPPQDFVKWKQDVETEIQRVFDVAQSDMHNTLESFRKGTRDFAEQIRFRHSMLADEVNDVRERWNWFESRTFRGRMRRLSAWVVMRFYRVRYFHLWYHDDERDADDE